MKWRAARNARAIAKPLDPRPNVQRPPRDSRRAVRIRTAVLTWSIHVSQRLCVDELAQPLQRAALDLADALASDVEDPTHFVERARSVAAESVAQLERSEEHTSELQSHHELVC